MDMDLSAMKVTDLRKELKKLGLPSIGTKQDLVQRLEGVRERAGTGTENVESKLPAEDLLAGGDDGLLDDDELLGEDDSNGSNGDVGDGEPVIPVVPIKTTVSIQNPIQPIQTSPVLKKKNEIGP